MEIERKYMGAGLRIIVVGRLVDCTFKEVEQLLKRYACMHMRFDERFNFVALFP